MAEVQEIKKVVEDIVSSYEKKVENINTIFDSTPLILNDLQQSILDRKDEREKIKTQLRDILAKGEHLRRKDFDNMMQRILQTQEQREKKVRELLKNYFNEQKAKARALREGLEKFKDSLGHGETGRIKEFQALTKEIFAGQDERKNEVISKLKGFQKEQHDLSIRLKELLAKGNELRIRDFKLMLKEFNAQREERLALQKKRKEEVAKMLAGFKKARRKATASPKSIHPVRKDTLSQNEPFNGVNIDVQNAERRR